MTNRGQLPTNQLHDINWGVFDHASFMHPNFNLHVATACVCVCVQKRLMCMCMTLYNTDMSGRKNEYYSPYTYINFVFTVQDAVRSISWRAVKRMPKRLECAQSVFLHGRVYVGSERTILQYSIDHNQWSELPRPPQKDFTMAVLSGKLVLVGGFEASGIFSQDVSNKISVWDHGARKWIHPYPCIPTARYAVSSVSYKSCLIVAGGRESVPIDASLVSHQIEVPSLSNVDILDSATSTWYSGDPLPFECHAMHASVIGDTLYLLGGRNRFDFTKAVIWASLPSLISKCSPTPMATASSTTSYCWNVLPPCPHFASSVPYYTGNHGNGNTSDDHNHGDATTGTTNVPLLAIGGHTGMQLSLLGDLETARLSKEIHAYSHVTGRWARIDGELPEVCVGCSCCVLPSGALFVAGGGRFTSPLNSAYIGTPQK